MHSSRMRTAHVSTVTIHGGRGVCLSACWDTQPPRCGPGDPPGPGQTPQLASWVWAWRPPHARHAGILPAGHAGIPPCASPLFSMRTESQASSQIVFSLTVTLGINGTLLWHLNIQFLLDYLCSTELGDEVEFDQGHKEDSESLSEETFETELSFSVTQTPKVSCTNIFTVTANFRSTLFDDYITLCSFFF